MTTTELTILGGAVLLIGAFGYVTLQILLKYEDWSTRRATDKRIRQERIVEMTLKACLKPSKKYPFGRTHKTLQRIAEKQMGRKMSRTETIEMLEVIGARWVWSSSESDRVWTFLK
jgi:hypothetical protein